MADPTAAPGTLLRHPGQPSLFQPHLLGLTIALALLPLACVGPSEAPAERPKRELTAEEFRDLLAKGTIRPTDTLEDDPFAKFDASGMGDPEAPKDPPVTPPASGSETTGQLSELGTPPSSGTPPPAPAAAPSSPPENPYLVF